MAEAMHCLSPARVKHSILKNLDGLGTRKEAQTQSPWSSKQRGLCPREEELLGKGLGVKASEV
jgi:hypothetical protein